MAVSIKTDGQNRVSVGEPGSLFKFASFTTIPENNNWVYAPSPDGRRFLVAARTERPRGRCHRLWPCSILVESAATTIATWNDLRPKTKRAPTHAWAVGP